MTSEIAREFAVKVLGWTIPIEYPFGKAWPTAVIRDEKGHSHGEAEGWELTLADAYTGLERLRQRGFCALIGCSNNVQSDCTITIWRKGSYDDLSQWDLDSFDDTAGLVLAMLAAVNAHQDEQQ